tara:strand:- start:50 stop:295 length:246 start_codon:yes stop_codon:yes gene_type:complete
MFVSRNPQDDVVKLRNALSDIKFICEQTLVNDKELSEKTKATIDDIIQIVDFGMYKEPLTPIEEAKQLYAKKYGGCCDGED